MSESPRIQYNGHRTENIKTNVTQAFSFLSYISNGCSRWKNINIPEQWEKASKLLWLWWLFVSTLHLSEFPNSAFDK